MLILASASPRRQELLSLIEKEFTVLPANVDETIPQDMSPKAAVEEIARRKAHHVWLTQPEHTIIGADTIVVLQDKIFGKPKSSGEACEMLRELSGKTHTVYTGVCVIKDGEQTTFSDTTEVTFAAMSSQEILEYVETGEPLDKAGAYGIQGKASAYITKIHGNYHNVMGLPIPLVYQILRRN